MSTSNSSSKPGLGDRDGDVQLGVDSYGRALHLSGGNQVQALIRGGKGQGVGAALYETPSFELSVPALPVARLSVNLTNGLVMGGVEGESLHCLDSRRYSLFLTPASTPMRFCKAVPSRHMNIYFSPEALSDGEETRSPLSLARPLLNVGVPGIRSLVDQLVNELRSPVMLHADAADSLSRLLLVQVARHWRQMSTKPRTLHPTVLARLRDYVMAHLGERILVADMARQAGLSPDTFAVAYKEQTGQAPHQYVLATRLQHAADLLRTSTLSVADVAHVCGFASQQHLTNVMRSHLGTTPRRYRESIRPPARF